MKKVLKWFLRLLLLVAVVVISFFAYLYFKKVDNKDLLSVVPEDAIYILSTSNLSDGWTSVSNSKIWQHLKTNAYFAELNESASTLDSLLKNNSTMEMLFKDRQLVVSAHMKSATDYDFLFVVDVQKAGQASFLFETIGLFSDYTITKRNYKGQEIIDMLDVKEKETLSLTFSGNLLIASYSSSVLEKAIDNFGTDKWSVRTEFTDVSSLTGSSMFRLYLNYSILPRFLKCYLSETSELVEDLSQSLAFTAFSINLENERLSCKGYTSIADSIPSFFKALQGVKPGKMRAYEIIPEKTALFISICFENFPELLDNFKEFYKSTDTSGYENYEQNIQRLEKFLKINLNEDFFGWISNELTFVKLEPEANAREEDVIVVIGTKEAGKAQEGLSRIQKQVKKRTPVKFIETDYKGFTINQLYIKGFFKMFFGKLFGKLEKPYYTFIGNYVVFSNSDSQLMDFVDDYLGNKTLARNPVFMNFLDDFESSSNVSVFVQTLKLYKHIYYYSKEQARTGIQKNKDLILSFIRIGFQMVGDGGKFRTVLISEHNPEALLDETLENIEKSAEDLFVHEFDSLQFKVDLTGAPVDDNVPVKLYYNETDIMSEGSVIDGKPHGIWKNYYPSGNIQSIIRYREGMVNGQCIFYYDDHRQLIKAEVPFIEDKIDGLYKEYYMNGQIKASLNFVENVISGDAGFFYDRGKLKAKGKYKDGLPEGKWKYFNESGVEISRRKNKSGSEKN